MTRTKRLLYLLLALGALGAEGATLTDEIKQARKDDVAAPTITERLIVRGERAEEVAQIVAQVYGNCRDTTLAVAAAARAAPRSAESIVIAVAGLENCGCTADKMWSRSRLEERLRLPLTHRLVELEDRDACAAAATQGGVFELPERSGSLVEAALIAKQESLLPEDSLGWVNTDRERADWSVALPESATAFRRRSSVCRGDQNPRDRFNPGDEWEFLDAAAADPRAPWAPECKEDDDEEDLYIDQILIAELALGRDQPNYVKLYNGNDHPIRLEQLGYRLLVSAPGSEVAEAMVPLRGEILSRGIFVLGDERMPPGSLDQLAPGLSIRPGDALILDLGWEARVCDSITAIVAGAYRAAEEEEPLAGQVTKSALIRHKLARHFGALEGQTPGWVTDAVGQVPLVDTGDDQVPLLGSPLARLPRQCQPDGNETNSFDVVPPWQFADGINLGSYPTNCPPSDEPQLVISELVNGDEDDDALEMFNGTPAEIDLDKDGYYLEIFRNGERDPSEVIQLEGVIGPGGAFVVANPDTDEITREAADQVTAELNLADASAVLLVREVIPSARQCDQIALAALLGPSDVVFVPVPAQLPPIRVDPLASPN